MDIPKSIGVGVGTFLFKKDSRKILISKRLGKSGTGLFALPGGSVERFEEIWETAIREIKEETDIDI
jgi:ADP-ribose pyrophosphatase YjhB (NUDIX family)